MEKKTKEMSSVELKADGKDVSCTWKSSKTPLDSSNETSILMTDNARSSDGNSTDSESLNTASLMIEDKYEVEFEHLDNLDVDMDNKKVDGQLEHKSNDRFPENQSQTAVVKNHEDFQNDSHRCIDNADTDFASMVLIEKKMEKMNDLDTAGDWMQDQDLLENNSDEVSGFSVVDLKSFNRSTEPFTFVQNSPDGKETQDCYTQLETLTDEESSREKYGPNDKSLSKGTSSAQNAEDPESCTHGHAFIKKQEKTINEHDNVNVTYQEEEAVKADSSITEFNKVIVKSQEEVKAERSKTDCVIDNVTHQEEAVKVGNLLIIDSGISSNVDSGCQEGTTKTPDHHDGQTKKKEKKHFMERLRSFATYNYSFEDEEHKENRKHAMEKFEYFWLKDDVFSQWHESKFKVKGEMFCNAEQYMMYMKAVLFKDYRIAKKIMKTSDPKKIKALGRKVYNFDEPTWRAQCLDVVKTANLAKFSQNKKLKEKLFKTHPKILVEASPYDKIWGIGLAADQPEAFDDRKWKGLNLLGYVLTEVRDQLMCEEHQITAEKKKEFLETLKASYFAEVDSRESTQWPKTEKVHRLDTVNDSNLEAKGACSEHGETRDNSKTEVVENSGQDNVPKETEGTEKHSTISDCTQNSHLMKRHGIYSNNNPAEICVPSKDIQKYDEEYPELRGAKAQKEKPIRTMEKKLEFDMDEAGASNRGKDNRNMELEQPKQDVFSSDKDDALGRTSEKNDSKSNNTVKLRKEESRDVNETISVEYQDKANVLSNVSELKSETRNIPNDEAIFAKAEKDDDDKHQDEMKSMLSEFQSEPTKTNESYKLALCSKSNSGDVVEHEEKTNKLLNSFLNISSIGITKYDGAAYGQSVETERNVADQPLDVGTKPKERLYETVGLTNKEDKTKPDKKLQNHFPGIAKKVTESNTKKKKK